MALQPHDCFRSVEGFDRSEVPDGYVIYDEKREQVHFLNVTAAAVLESCDGSRDLDSIALGLQAAFELPQPPLEEVTACLENLLGQGLVEPCPPSSSAA